jgi:hypothetical protein
VITARDTTAAARRWQQLLDPLQPSEPLTWRPSIGPAIRLIHGDDDRIDQLTLAVRSIESADRVWRETGQEALPSLPLRLTAGDRPIAVGSA